MSIIIGVKNYDPHVLADNGMAITLLGHGTKERENRLLMLAFFV